MTERTFTLRAAVAVENLISRLEDVKGKVDGAPPSNTIAIAELIGDISSAIRELDRLVERKGGRS